MKIETVHENASKLVEEAKALRDMFDPRSPTYSYFDGKVAGILAV